MTETLCVSVCVGGGDHLMLEQMFCFYCTYDFIGRGQGSTEKWMDVLGIQSAAKLTSRKS